MIRWIGALILLLIALYVGAWLGFWDNFHL